MIPAAQVQAMATIKTAPVKANWAVVPQIPSGRANKSANPTAMPPARAVETRRALKSAQQGPTMSRLIKMTRVPRTASAAAMSNMSTTLSRQIAFEGHLRRMAPLQMPRARALVGSASIGSRSPSDNMAHLAQVSAACGLVPNIQRTIMLIFDRDAALTPD